MIQEVLRTELERKFIPLFEDGFSLDDLSELFDENKSPKAIYGKAFCLLGTERWEEGQRLMKSALRLFKPHPNPNVRRHWEHLDYFTKITSEKNLRAALTQLKVSNIERLRLPKKWIE